MKAIANEFGNDTERELALRHMRDIEKRCIEMSNPLDENSLTDEHWDNLRQSARQCLETEQMKALQQKEIELHQYQDVVKQYQQTEQMNYELHWSNEPKPIIFTEAEAESWRAEAESWRKMGDVARYERAMEILK